MDYVGTVIYSLVIGFAISTIIATLLQWLAPKRMRKSIERFVSTGIKIIRIVGIVCGVLTFSTLVIQLTGRGLPERAFGEYAFHYWLMLLGCPLLTQLLWFDRIGRSGIFRILIGLGLLFSSGRFMEELIITMSSFERDHQTNNGLVLGFLSSNLVRFLSFAALVWLLQSVNTRRDLLNKNKTQI